MIRSIIQIPRAYFLGVLLVNWLYKMKYSERQPNISVFEEKFRRAVSLRNTRRGLRFTRVIPPGEGGGIPI